MEALLVPGGVAVTMVVIFLGWLLSGGVRKTDADRLWDEQQKLYLEMKRDRNAWRQRCGRLSRRLDKAEAFQRAALPILQKCANGDPELARQADVLGLLTPAEPTR